MRASTSPPSRHNPTCDTLDPDRHLSHDVTAHCLCLRIHFIYASLEARLNISRTHFPLRIAQKHLFGTHSQFSFDSSEGGATASIFSDKNQDEKPSQYVMLFATDIVSLICPSEIWLFGLCFSPNQGGSLPRTIRSAAQCRCSRSSVMNALRIACSIWIRLLLPKPKLYQWYIFCTSYQIMNLIFY